MATPIEQLLLPRPRRAQLDPAQRIAAGAEVVLVGVDPSLPPEGYRLTISGDGTVRLAAADDAGQFYARATLRQLARVAGPAGLPVGTVEDWPDLAVRGVMLDVSRCKVPTLETLVELVDRLASWKVNHLQLYMEHTFAYAGHDDVWRGADPYDEADLASLAAHCRSRHMELVANQNCLGHMERWLIHPRYAGLGIARGVTRGPLGMAMPASTLDPSNQGSLPLVRELLGSLCAALPAPWVHVGLDEPWDLPAERSDEWGTWLERVRALPELADRHLLVWGDMLAGHRALAETLPDGVTVCEWGYEANHPFLARTARLAALGRDHWVAPGTSSWLSILGRTTNALDNCREAAAAAQQSGAGGMLVTDWGDFGHLQYAPVSDPGFAAAAAFSWCATTNDDLDAAALAELLNLHCYEDPTGMLGGAVTRVGDAHTLQPAAIPNVSGLVLHLYFPQLPVGRFGEALTHPHLDAVDDALCAALDELDHARPGTEHGRRSVDELAAAVALVQLLWRDARARIAGDGTLSSIPTALRQSLAEEMDDLVALHGIRWLTRNRRGGLEESSRWLTHLHDCYRSGEADEDWAGPLVERIRGQDTMS